MGGSKTNEKRNMQPNSIKIKIPSKNKYLMFKY